MSTDRPSTVSVGTVLLVVSVIVAVALAVGFAWYGVIEPRI